MAQSTGQTGVHSRGSDDSVYHYECGHSSSKTHHTTLVTDKILSLVTITDPIHPLFQHTLPVVRQTLWRGKPQVVVRLTTGRTRSVPITATDYERVTSSNALSVQLL